MEGEGDAGKEAVELSAERGELGAEDFQVGQLVRVSFEGPSNFLCGGVELDHLWL